MSTWNPEAELAELHRVLASREAAKGRGVQIMDRGEEAKRQSVLTRRPETVLVKLGGIGRAIEGLAEKTRDDVAIEMRHRDEAATRGLDARAYRGDQADTGYQIFNNAPQVYVDELVADLEASGLHYAGGHWFDRGGKAVNVLEFSCDESRRQELPEPVREALALRYQACTVWANWKFRDAANRDAGQYRLDTVNLNAGAATRKGGQVLHVRGNSYVFTERVGIEPERKQKAAPAAE